jgi:polar amino acid transport system substrate-binding protein
VTDAAARRQAPALRLGAAPALLLAGAAAALLALASCGGGGARGAPSAPPSPPEIAKASTLAKVLERRKLVVGMEVEFWPFEYEDAEGRRQGFDVDLAGRLAEALGVELEVRDMAWAALIPSLQDGRVDVVISGMTATLERARAIAFSEPYFRTGLCVLLHRERGAGIRSAEDLDRPGTVIAVKTGTTGHLVAEKRFPRAELRTFRDEGACGLEVAEGRASAFIYDQITVAKLAKRHAASTRALLEPFTREPLAIATRQGEHDLLRFIDQLLRTMREDGDLAALERKHLGELGLGQGEGRGAGTGTGTGTGTGAEREGGGG